jgi:hypothetical protein
MPTVSFIKRAMPLQTAFQVDRALGDTRGLDNPRRFHGQARFRNFVIVGKIDVDSLKTLRIVIEGGVIDTLFPLTQDVGIGMVVVEYSQQRSVIVSIADQKPL